MKRILIVDDDPGIVDLIKNRLENDHYEVICADDGSQGIKQAKEQKPDLIIMDILMPKMPGGEAVRLLRRDVKTEHIPIIFLTAVTGGVTGINVDGQFYTAIAKPFEPAELLFEIKKLIGN